MNKNFLKIGKAAKYLGVCSNTIRNWIKQGRPIEYYRDNMTGYRYFDPADLDAFKKSMRISSSDSVLSRTSCDEPK